MIRACKQAIISLTMLAIPSLCISSPASYTIEALSARPESGTVVRLSDRGHVLVSQGGSGVQSTRVQYNGTTYDLTAQLGGQAVAINNRGYVIGNLQGKVDVVIASNAGLIDDLGPGTPLCLDNRGSAAWLSSVGVYRISWQGRTYDTSVSGFVPRCMNDQGEAVGPGWYDQQTYGTAIWREGSVTAISSDPPYDEPCIDNAGRALLNSYDPSVRIPTAWVWQRGAEAAVTLPQDCSWVTLAAANDRLEAVGIGYFGRVRGQVGVIWSGGQVQDLNDLVPSDSGYHIVDALDINNMGEIACLALHEGSCVYLILTPGPGVKTWKGLAMVSVPSIPWDADPKLATGLDTNYWYSYDPTSRAYAGYANRASWLEPTDSTPVRGFWARFVKETRVPLWIIPQQGKPVSIPLKPGWNLIGQPFLLPVDWNTDALQVKTSDGVARSVREASDAVRPFAWGWKQDPANSSTGAYYMVAESTYNPNAARQLQPWEGYWVKALRDCELILPAPPAEY